MKKLFFLLAVTLLSINTFSAYIAIVPGSPSSAETTLESGKWHNIGLHIYTLPRYSRCGLHLQIANEGAFSPSKYNNTPNAMSNLTYYFSGYYINMELWGDENVDAFAWTW